MKQNKKKKYRLKRFHISYGKRVLFYSILFLLCLLFGIKLIFSSFTINKEEKILFNETGNIDYQVCLKENDFFEKECLDKDMSYVASLIDKIYLEFNYTVGGNKVYLEKDLKYKIVGNLVILNKDNSSKYFEKEYILKDLSSDNILTKGLFYNIDDKINIDYDYYNKIANSFKSEYAVDVESYLDISLVVYNEYDSIYNIPSSNNLSIKVPLSEKSIQIKLDTDNINNSNVLNVKNEEFTISNFICLFTSIILLVLSMYYFVNLVGLLLSLFGKKSPYDKVLNKYLKEYDRLIVETSSLPSFSDYNLLKINSFEELIDVRDNLRLPIMYYLVVPHSKAYFYILQDTNIYVFTLKEVDLVDNEKKKD